MDVPMAQIIVRRSTEPGLGFPSLSTLKARSADDSHGPFPEALMAQLLQPGGASPQAVRDLEEFVHRLFVLDMPRSYWLANTVAIAIITSLLLAGALTILHRLYKRKFWLWKITRRSEGLYFIPNALNCFLICEGAFAFLYITFTVVQWLAYSQRVDGAQAKIASLHIVVWVPLWLGAYIAGWGSFYTAPGAFERGPWSKSRLFKWCPRPLFINLVCFGTPILLMGSLTPVIVLGQRQLDTSFAAYKAFSAVALAAADKGTANPATVRLLLQGASGVWKLQMHYIALMALGWTIWPVFAAVFLLCYIFFGGYLLWLVWNQLRRQKKLLEDIQVRQKVPSRNRFSQVSAEHPQAHSPKGPSDSLLFQPLVTDGTSVTMTHDRKLSDDKANALDYDSDGVRKEKFFPPLRPDVHKKAARRLKDAGSPLSRYHYLRRCFINILLLYVSISIGAAAYLCISAALGARIFRAQWHGYRDLTTLYCVCNLVSSWIGAIFGTLSFASIYGRWFDPANARNEDEDGKIKRKLPGTLPFKRSAKATDIIIISPHDKTRTLPAVPESVGPATFELSSTSVLDNEEGSKLSLRRDKRRPSEASVLPIDATASLVSINIPGAEALRKTRSTKRKPSAGFDEISAIERELEQAESQRSYRSGRTVYYPTPFGPMAAPARDIPKPLPPARTPPRVLALPEDSARGSPRGSISSTPARASLGSIVRHSYSHDSLVNITGPVSRSASSSALATAYANAELTEEDEYIAQSPTQTLVGSLGGPRSPTSARGWVQREWAASETAEPAVRSSLSMNRKRRPSVLETTTEYAAEEPEELSQESDTSEHASRWRSASLPPRPSPERPLPRIPGPALFSHVGHPASSPSRDAAPYTSPNRPMMALLPLQPPPGARRAVLSASPRNTGDLPLVSPGVFF